MAAPVLTCVEWDAVGHVCTVEAWVEQAEPALPSLTIEEAQEIGIAIALLWAIAYTFRVLARFIREM